MLDLIVFIAGFFIGFFATSAYFRSQIRQHYLYLGDESLQSLQDKITPDAKKSYNPEEQLLYAKMLQAGNKEIKRKEF